MMREQWVDQANCHGLAHSLGHSLFFPTREESIDIDIAQCICRECPVRIPCLDYAMREGEEFGVWGGLSFKARKKLKRKRKKEHEEFLADVMPVIREVAALITDNPDETGRWKEEGELEAG